MIVFCIIGLIISIVSIYYKVKGAKLFCALWVLGIVTVILRSYTDVYVIISIISTVMTILFILWIALINKANYGGK